MMSPESSDPQPRGAGSAELEATLEDGLVRMEAFHDEACEAMCREHPSLADAIRARFEALRVGDPVFESSDAAVASDGDGGIAELPGPVGPYRPRRELGRGGQAIVYLAEDTRLKRTVALKVLARSGGPARSYVQRFRREAEVASRLDHPNICAVYDADVAGGIPYIAMRYVPGRTLADVLQNLNADPKETAVGANVPQSGAASAEILDPRSRTGVLEVVALIESVARGLHAAHEAGVVHRDVKPGNIMVAPDRTPVILDFGLAAAEADEAALTRTGDVQGSPAYMSPEQVRADRARIDGRTDIYGLGVTLFECLALKRPFDAPTRAALYREILDTPAPDLARLNSEVTRDLAAVVERAMEKNPAQRYPTALTFAEDLRCVRSGVPTRARPVGPLGRLLRFARRRPGRVAALAAAAVVVCAISVMGGTILANRPRIERERLHVQREALEARLQEGFFKLHGHRNEEAVTVFRQALALNPGCTEALAGMAIALDDAGRKDAALAHLRAYSSGNPRSSALARLEVEMSRAPDREREAEDPGPPASMPRQAVDFYLDGVRLRRRGEEREDRDAVRRSAFEFLRAMLASPHPRALYHCEFTAALRAVGDTTLARDAARIVTTRWPGLAQAWLAGALAFSLTDPETAARWLNRALSLGPEDAAAHLLAGAVYHRLRRYDDALAATYEAKARVPTHAFAHCNLSAILFDLGRVNEALAAARRAVDLDPDCPPALFNLGKALAESGDRSQANEHYRRALEQNPRYAAAHAQLGVALYEMGQGDEGSRHLDRALELRPDDADVHQAVGWAYLIEGDAEHAVEALDRALELDPDHPRSLYFAGCAYARLRDWDGAQAALERALVDARLRVDVLKLLAAVLIERGDPKAAVVRLEAAVEFAPDRADVHSALAEAEIQAGNDEAAVEAFERSIQLDPKRPMPYRNLAILHLQSGRREEARDALEIYVKLTGSVEDQYNLGVLYSELGEVDEAIDTYRRAIRQRADFAEAYHGLADVLYQEGRLGEALRTLHRIHALGLKREHWPHLTSDWLQAAEKKLIREALTSVSQGFSPSDGPRDAGPDRRSPARVRKWLTALLETWRAAIRDEPASRKRVARLVARLIRHRVIAQLRNDSLLDALKPKERGAWNSLLDEFHSLQAAVKAATREVKQ